MGSYNSGSSGNRTQDLSRLFISRSARMELMDDEFEGLAQMEPTCTPLIYGLPDDIALFCLARVPRKYHSVLKCVSKRWKELVSSEEWHYTRQKHNLEETWLYALCRDKSQRVCFYVLDLTRRCWKPIQAPPTQLFKRKGMACEVLGKKVYLLGGCGWSEDATDEVYCFDASSNTWAEATPLPSARCYFACEAVNEKIFAIGGVGSNSSDPHSWDVYDPNTNSWTSYSDPNIVADVEESFVLDGKIYIRCGASISSRIYAVVYDPASGTWQHADEDMISGWRGPAVVVEGILYVLDQSLGTKLMMWRKESRDWMAIGRLSPLLTRPPCRLVAIKKSIFIIGKGLSTVVFDIGKTRNMGVMVGSSIPRLTTDDDVISVKALTM